MIKRLVVNHKVVIPITEMDFVSSKSGGPGGQHVNKVNSKVTLRFNVQESSYLTDQQKKRILSVLQSRVSKDGMLQIHSQRYRSQTANREDLVQRMEILLRSALRPQKKRVPTKISKSAKEKRFQEKKHRGKVKVNRSKPNTDESM